MGGGVHEHRTHPPEDAREQKPGKENVPIWFTEIGRDAAKDETSQATALVKAFTMAIAQGVTRINWFEGKDGDSGPMGLLRGDGTAAPGVQGDVESYAVSRAQPQIYRVGLAERQGLRLRV